MAYNQLEQPTFFCPECGKEFTLNDNRVQYGLFSDKQLIRCSTCFEKIKHEFWLRRVAEG